MSDALKKMMDEYEGEETQSNGTEDTLQIALNEILSNNNMSLKSDLNKKQIVALAKAQLFADRHKSKAMQQLIDSLLELSVSNKRQGRQELVQLMQSYRDLENDKESGTLDRLLGRD